MSDEPTAIELENLVLRKAIEDAVVTALLDSSFSGRGILGRKLEAISETLANAEAGKELWQEFKQAQARQAETEDQEKGQIHLRMCLKCQDMFPSWTAASSMLCPICKFCIDAAKMQQLWAENEELKIRLGEPEGLVNTPGDWWTRCPRDPGAETKQCDYHDRSGYCCIRESGHDGDHKKWDD